MTDHNQAEWLLQQQSYDQMEKQALWLKVVAIVLWLWLVQTESSLILQLGLIGVFWLHEAIWKTQQSRTLERLLVLEQAIAEARNIGCQWHQSWLQQRGGVVNLALSYLKHSFKPTVAITYLVLLAATLVRHFN
ncbi:MAG: hypothetical protein KKF79_11485 [Gammaproteobacteria bacterium]|jgi:hypothetical protein|nr:hypothetical protein [Gammaproteobacteria bacterium]MBU2224555.1 hypothetical protein [Gammaproteobacteria bacterium]MBU2280266.1 hypothetical protein [Gammaproteobacteria bacterium]MBU2425472.1 hypothetical protein [Gammaproteobacteria bacterium]